MDHDLGIDLLPEEHLELLVSDLSLARAFYAGIPAARLLARIRLASDERDVQVPGSKPGFLSWDALLQKFLRRASKDDVIFDRARRAIARHTRAASDEGALAANDSIVAVLVFALAASSDADASVAEVFTDGAPASGDSEVLHACAAYEPRLKAARGDHRGVLFEACVRLATHAAAGPWPRDRIVRAREQLLASELAVDLLRPSSATLFPLDFEPDVPRATRRMVLLERAELDSLLARDPRELALSVARHERERAGEATAYLDRLLGDLTKLLARKGALVLATLHPGLPIEESEPASLPSERPASWMPTNWTSPDAAASLADGLERGSITMPRLFAVIQRGGEPALDAIGAEMLSRVHHPFANAAFAEVLARSGRARDVMRLVTYFAVASDPASVAYALSLCTSPHLPNMLYTWLSSMLPTDGALAPRGEDPTTSSAARLSACIVALRAYPHLYRAVRPLLARVTDPPPSR